MSEFNSAYEGIPPWDIGRPQKELIRLVRKGEVRGSILDVGCGTGENVLYLASLGREVWGVDAARLAVQKAREKAQTRGLEAHFEVADALKLQLLGRQFDTVIDIGLFHVFTDEERPIFVRSLASVLRLGGAYYVLCFSEHEPNWGGPRRVTKEEIHAMFSEGWKINYIRGARFETNIHAKGARGWLASMERCA